MRDVDSRDGIVVMIKKINPGEEWDYVYEMGFQKFKGEWEKFASNLEPKHFNQSIY